MGRPDQRAGFGDDERAAATEIFQDASAEYDDMVKRAVRRAMVPNFERQARTRAANALKDLESWRGNGSRNMDALRPLERAMDVPYFRRDDMRNEMLDVLRAGDPDELHRADPRVEEALERGDRTKIRNTPVGEWGFPEACAEDVIDHATALAGSDSARGGLLRRGE